MTVAERWIDLVDPSAEMLSEHLPQSIHARAMEQLLAPSTAPVQPGVGPHICAMTSLLAKAKVVDVLG